MITTTPKLFCPDCGAKCEHTGTNGMENQWCFSCSNPEHKNKYHWERYAGRVEYVRESECEICRDQRASLECPLCNLPSESGWVHGDCVRREQAIADRE